MNEITQFRIVLRGYEPTQVDHSLRELTQAVDAARREAAERTIAASKLSASHAELAARLEERETQITSLEDAQRSAPAPAYADLGQRIGSMLTLADEEAKQITADAKEVAAQIRQSAMSDADATRIAADRYAENVRTEADAAAARVVEDAKRQADSILDEADREASARRGEAEAVYENQRAKAAAAAADFETTLAERRHRAAEEFGSQMAAEEQTLANIQERSSQLSRESEQAHAEATSAAHTLIDSARNEAAAILGAAKDHAERIRRDSERELAAATARRDSITAQLTNVRQMLGTLGGASMVEPVDSPASAGAAPADNTASEAEAALAPEPVPPAPAKGKKGPRAATNGSSNGSAPDGSGSADSEESALAH